MTNIVAKTQYKTSTIMLKYEYTSRSAGYFFTGL